MTIPLEALFEAVRDACTPAAWSRGVELTRAGSVIAERTDAEEAVFRISQRGGMFSPTVTLYPEDGDWECRCSSQEDACEHVAAAVIAWRRSRQEGAELTTPEEAGQVEYRFERQSGGLALSRVIVRGGKDHALEATLTAVASGKVDGPRFVASQADLAVELALGTHRRGLLPNPLVSRLLVRLARCSAIRLDGTPVAVSPEPVLPRARLEDQGEGFRLTLVDDPDVTEVFGNGIVMCRGTLRPVGQARLTGRELHELAGGRHFTFDEVGLLVTEILPSLRRRIPVDVETRRLPDTVRERPRVQLELQRQDRTLQALATIVYGDPPQARIDGGRLVRLREGPVPLRDEPEERRLVRRLQHELQLVPGVRDELVGEQAVHFSARLGGWEESIRGGGHDWFRQMPELVPRLELEGTRFDVEFASGGKGQRAGRADAGEVLRAWRGGESLVPLLRGGWAPLPADWLRRFGHRVADLLEARDARGNLPRATALDLVRLCDELDHPAPPELGGLRRSLEDFESIASAELPGDLRATLRSYQQQGVDWLVFLRDAGLGALLADDMGLGKTLQALCAIRGRTLVVAPTSVLHNWADEIERFRPGLSCSVYHGPRRALDPAVDVTLTTYALLRLDAETLAGEHWDTLVLDEAQAIKNPDSQVADAAYRLQADFRLTLTGTPVENRLDELWSQFHFINRGLLGGRQSFQQRYTAPIAAGEPGAAQRLRERIRPFILRRLKKEVAADLPPRTEVVLRCELSEPEREIYDTVRAATLSGVVEQLRAGGSVLAALEALLRLRQAACHPGLLPGHTAAGSSKLTLLMETLDSVIAEGHKALVFSQWTSMLDLTEPHLREAGIAFLRLDGSTRDRAAVVRGFQDDAGPPVLLISLKAGGTGLNLTAADHVLLLDLWWNPAVEAQAADRAHRIGQTRPVMVYRLVAEETVEERILTLQQTKRAVAEAAIGDADQAASLTRDQILDLLG